MDVPKRYDDALTREKLIDAVERQQMTREQAEAEASRLGFESLLPSHPAVDFNPMAQERWSLLMGLIWVLTRNPDAVRNSWNDYLMTQYQWAREGMIGPERAVRKPSVWMHQIGHHRSAEYLFADSPGRSFSVSWALLRQALRNGAVVAWGRDLREGDLSDVRPIPKANWDALSVGEMPLVEPPLPESVLPLPRLPFSPRPVGEDMLHFGNKVPVYSSVTVEVAGLIEAFHGADTDSADFGQASAIDPMRLIAASVPPEETKPARKKRVRIEAIQAAFPDGVPPAMPAKERDKLLEAEVKRIDPTVGTYSERSWTRLCTEVAEKD